METPPLGSSLEGVAFTSIKVADTFGRQLVQHRYPNGDTNHIEDLGRLPASYQVEGVIYGPGWMDRARKLRALAEELQARQVITYIHPFWGPRTGRVEQLQVVTSEAQTDFASISFGFIEGQAVTSSFQVAQSIQAAGAAAQASIDALSSATAALEVA